MTEWISVKDRLPEPETEVLIRAEREYNRKTHSIITTAMYEDGTISEDDSCWFWNELDGYGTYDEEKDCYRIPQGWWEYRHYNQDDSYSNMVDDVVTHWMPLPDFAED